VVLCKVDGLQGGLLHRLRANGGAPRWTAARTWSPTSLRYGRERGERIRRSAQDRESQWSKKFWPFLTKSMVRARGRQQTRETLARNSRNLAQDSEGEKEGEIERGCRGKS
jgi:hypothetical protein